MSSGTAILANTCPLAVSAAFTSPSVPAEYNCPPSIPKLKLLQLPLCLRVLHVVSICPWPFSETVACSSLLLSLAIGGRRKVWTWPPASPTERIGSVGWIAWVKRSDVRGKVQIVSNMEKNCEGSGLVFKLWLGSSAEKFGFTRI